jgi:hypothetical protein
MGVTPPPRPPREGPGVCIVARVAAIDPAVATWATPAMVTLEVVGVLRPGGPVSTLTAAGVVTRDPTPLPPRVPVAFGAPPDAGQQAFYITRFHPPDEAEQLARLWARQVPLPALGSTVIVWLEETAPGAWGVIGSGNARWTDCDPEALRRVREDLGLTAPSRWGRLLQWLGLG